jgi:chromosome segregation ATPase
VQKFQVEYDRTAEERDRLVEEMEQLLADAQDLDRQRQQLTGELESFRAGESELVKDRDELTAQLEQLQAEHANVATQRDQLTDVSQSLQDRLDKLQAEKTAQAEECDRLTAELTAAAQQNTEAQQRAQTLEAELQAQREEHSQINQALAESRATIDNAAGELTKNEQLVVELHDEIGKQKTSYEAQLEELKKNLDQSERKCELALADVHKLKRANAELHEELVRRPETNDQQSPELVSLRAERDALAARVEELGSAAAPQQDEQQAMSDLQRRFEMAVEDLRHLKQENASLRERLEAIPRAASVASDSGGMDWQAQKARLLATLDAEDTDSATPQRREARTTIEGTISITDRVVGEKDREIAELREQLATRPAVADKPSEEVRGEAIGAAHEELFSSDELIQTERARLEQLQKEWKDKLRTAELEISVQRATLARDKAKLEEKLSFLQSQAAELAASEGKPKRRWLSALGLNEEPPESG